MDYKWITIKVKSVLDCSTLTARKELIRMHLPQSNIILQMVHQLPGLRQNWPSNKKEQFKRNQVNKYQNIRVSGLRDSVISQN